MKRLLLIILAFLILLPSTILANGPRTIEFVIDGKSYIISEDRFPVPFDITDPAGKILNLNKEIVQDKGYAVYGDYTSVPGNDKLEGQWRYLGYNLQGLPFSNFDFPWEGRVKDRLDKDRVWIKEPWEVMGNKGKTLENMISFLNGDKQAIEWLNAVISGESNGVETGWEGPKGKWTAEILLDYFNIISPQTDYTAGSVIGWHKDGINWYKVFHLEPNKIIDITKLEDEVEFMVLHYEKDTENEVYREDIITDSTVTEVYPKTGKGLDGNEWLCTLGTGPQKVEITDGGEYIFYYTKKEVPSGDIGLPTGGISSDSGGTKTSGHLILVKDPLVIANCKIPGRANIKKNDGGYHPNGMPLFRGDNFKPTGTIKNQNSRDTFCEYSMTLKDKPDKNFRQINFKKSENIIKVGSSISDYFTKKIDNNDRYGNVYILTVEARQRIIIPAPPPKPGPKPRKPGPKPQRSDYDNASDYRSDLADYRDDLESYYDELEAWYEKKERWDVYVEQWGNPDTGEVFKYTTYAGREIWFSEKYPWRNGKGEDLNCVMVNVVKDIEDMEGGLRPGVIIK